MEIAFNQFVLNIPVWIEISLGFIIAAAITYFSIPTILTVSHKLGLYERKNGRGSHQGQIPTLGGVAIFASVVVTGAVFVDQSILRELQYVLGALAILFFVGIKDDLLVLDPKKKLIAQILAAAIVVILGNIRITSFHGFMGITEIPYIVSVLFSVFVYIVIINGFNLIDGIDGLSAGIATIVALTFGTWFILTGQYAFAIVPFALSGSLIAFIRYNVFSQTRKIFLGDTGALSIGLLIAVVAVKFLEFDHNPAQPFAVKSSPAVAVGILIVPLFDTLRVFTLRVLRGESPFHADRRHIHHRLLDLGCSHLKATLIIAGVNVFFISLVFMLQSLGNLNLLLILISLASVFSYIPVFLLQRPFARREQRAKRPWLTASHRGIDINAVTYPD